LGGGQDKVVRGIEELKAFKKKHGHVRVTGKHDKGLASFCSNTRSARRGTGASVINEDRIKALNELGFAWGGGQDKVVRGTHRGTESIQREAWTCLWQTTMQPRSPPYSSQDISFYTHSIYKLFSIQFHSSRLPSRSLIFNKILQNTQFPQTPLHFAVMQVNQSLVSPTREIAPTV